MTLDEIIIEFEEEWRKLLPGSKFFVDGIIFIKMSSSHSHHTEDSIFNTKDGTIHHYSEYFLCSEGFDNIRKALVKS